MKERRSVCFLDYKKLRAFYQIRSFYMKKAQSISQVPDSN